MTKKQLIESRNRWIIECEELKKDLKFAEKVILALKNPQPQSNVTLEDITWMIDNVFNSNKRVDIEDILEHYEFRKRINSIPISEIEFYEDLKKVEIDPKLIEQWVYTGLNNLDFITTGFYKSNGFQEVKLT